MDLIKSINDYKKSKLQLKEFFIELEELRLKRTNTGYITTSFIVKELDLKLRIVDLNHSLLEYRRLNNIYEVGDKVVFVASVMGWLDDNKIHQVSRVSENQILKVCGLYVGFDAVKHATDVEIKQGCRI